MLQFYPSEIFSELSIDAPLKKRYAVSNYGRLISFTKDFTDGRELKGGRADGYRTLDYRIEVNGKKKSKYLFLYRLVAEHFIPKTADDQTNVLHLDYTRDNDHVNNLRWATRPEMLAHGQKSPHVIAARKIPRLGITGKLNATQVIRLKKLIHDPNRKTRLKIIAKQFGISEMQLHRIKSGENWGHIVV